MGEGSVWFRASIGSRKNAEARWLLPMICRRGGIDKSDIGAIRIMDTTSEFEISARAAESFAVKIRRPDKEDNIRIEALAGPSPREEVHEQAWTPKPHGKNAKSPDKPGFDRKARYDTKNRIGTDRLTPESRVTKAGRLRRLHSERRKRRSFAIDRRGHDLKAPPDA
jgi:ATP-dependent RNA helicase DeaD